MLNIRSGPRAHAAVQSAEKKISSLLTSSTVITSRQQHSSYREATIGTQNLHDGRYTAPNSALLLHDLQHTWARPSSTGAAPPVVASSSALEREQHVLQSLSQGSF